VATAAALAFNDAATTGKLHPVTKTALEKIWTVQRDDGGWDWLKCGWPPMESDDDYGVVLAALAVSVAPGDYATTKQAKLGMKRVRAYLQAHPGPTLHHRAMLLWAASYDKTLMSPAAQQKCQSELLKLQQEDGGWALATLGNWERGDGTRQDLDTSDGYGTGFATYVLLRSGMKPDSPPVAKGLKWLRSNQRESGRWFTRSLHADGMHFITHAGTAMAVMALAEAKEFAMKP
jgi:squalene-hopene/tetraprenyl-beta-curcumene cyclase